MHVSYLVVTKLFVRHCYGEVFNKVVISLLGSLMDSSSLVESVAFTTVSMQYVLHVCIM